MKSQVAVALTGGRGMRTDLGTEKMRVRPEQMQQMIGAPKRHLCRLAPPEGVASATGKGGADSGTATRAVVLETASARDDPASARVA